MLRSCVGCIIWTVHDMFATMINKRLGSDYDDQDVWRYMRREAVEIYLCDCDSESRSKFWLSRGTCSTYSDEEIARFRAKRAESKVTNALLDSLSSDFVDFEFRWLRSLQMLQDMCAPRSEDVISDFHEFPPFHTWNSICDELAEMSDTGVKRMLEDLKCSVKALSFHRV
jgi:hypothetical protein